MTSFQIPDVAENSSIPGDTMRFNTMYDSSEPLTFGRWRSHLPTMAKMAEAKMMPCLSSKGVQFWVIKPPFPGSSWCRYYPKSGRLVRFGKGSGSEATL